MRLGDWANCRVPWDSRRPELDFQGTDGRLYAWRNEVENIFDPKTDFQSALKSVSPSSMFGKAPELVRGKWNELKQTLPTVVRVVFAAPEFHESVHFCEREYNITYPSRPIMLFSLEDLKEDLGPVYSATKQQFRKSPANRMPDDIPTHASWLKMSDAAKTGQSEDWLRELCRIRGLPVSGTKEDLRQRLDSFQVDSEWYNMYWKEESVFVFGTSQEREKAFSAFIFLS